MNDLISRQNAIDALGEEPLIWHEGEDEIAERNQWRRDVNAIRAVPSAQPEERTDKRTETHACDLISRQALCDYALNQKDKSVTPNDIMRFPSAQPELIRCKDCKHNPKHEWFGCPMSHLSEKQRPDTAWCWRAERRTE